MTPGTLSKNPGPLRGKTSRHHMGDHRQGIKNHAGIMCLKQIRIGVVKIRGLEAFISSSDGDTYYEPFGTCWVLRCITWWVFFFPVM